MNKIFSGAMICGFFMLASVELPIAATLNPIIEIDAPIKYVDDITTFNTTGRTMTGMKVSVVTSGGTDFAYWDFLGSGTGAKGTGWSLTFSDPSKSTYFGGYWIFDVTAGAAPVSEIKIEGFNYNVLFDNEYSADPKVSTDGSSNGNSLYINVSKTTYAGSLTVSYTGSVALTGENVVGDLFQGMSIAFGTPFTATDVLAYYQDTDNIKNPVPEPATMLMIGLGLSGLVGMRIRKKM